MIVSHPLADNHVIPDTLSYHHSRATLIPESDNLPPGFSIYREGEFGKDYVKEYGDFGISLAFVSHPFLFAVIWQ